MPRSDLVAHSSLVRALACLALLLVAACGAPSVSYPDGESCTSLTPDQLFDRLGTTLSAHAVQCGGLATYLTADANRTIQAEVAASAAALDAAVAAKTVVYDPAKACQCLADLEHEVASCEPPAVPISCFDAIQGQVASGQACDVTVDTCAHGYCSLANGDTADSCGGLCKPWAEAGSSCYPGACDPAAGLTCVAGKCTSSGPAGKGARCNTDEDCAPSNYCARGTCAPESSSGAACGYDGFAGREYDGRSDSIIGGYSPRCIPGLACGGSVDYGGVQAGTCRAPSGVGGSCTPSDPSLDSITGCARGLACLGGTCQVPPSTGPCSADRSAFCRPDKAQCDVAHGRQCQPLPAGAPCSQTSDCPSGGSTELYCIQGACMGGGCGGCGVLLYQ